MLYLIPSVAGSPAQNGSRGGPEQPREPQPVGYVTQRSVEPTSLVTEQPIVAPNPTGATQPPEASRTEPRETPRRERGAAPRQRDDTPDREAPSTVVDLTFPTVTPDRLTVRWARASDNVAVIGYRIWLNGFHVAETTELQVAVPWFNDGSRQQVVQVRAVDGAGNQSEDAPARLVERPAASPSPTPTAAASTPESTPSTRSPSTESVVPETGPSTVHPSG
jgi:hypothetical protein